MEIDTVVRVRERMEIVVLNSCEIELVQERERALHVNVVVAGAMHHQEPDVALKTSHVADRRVLVAARIVLRGVHVSLSVYRICNILLVLHAICFMPRR